MGLLIFFLNYFKEVAKKAIDGFREEKLQVGKMKGDYRFYRQL